MTESQSVNKVQHEVLHLKKSYFKLHLMPFWRLKYNAASSNIQIISKIQLFQTFFHQCDCDSP